MPQASRQVLVGAFVAALALTDCAGGNPFAPSGQVPQTAATAQAASLPQNPQATPQPTPVANLAVARIVMTIAGTPAIGSPGTYPLTVTASSASGASISGIYQEPITLSDSDTSGATKLSVTSITNSTTTVALTYNGLGGSSLGAFNGATITATSGIVSNQVAFLSSATGCSTLKFIAGFYPCDLQSAYSLPSMTAGTGQTVAVVDAYDDPDAEADLAIYRSQFGLPPCTTRNACFTKVNEEGMQGHLPAADTTGWSLEESVDIDMVSAICPKCHIILGEADSPTIADLGSTVDAVAALGARQITNSYGESEVPTESAYDVHYNHPRATIVASAGDGDYGLEYPAASPYVTSVGGTNLSVAPNGRGWNESVWNNALVQGTGSGCSQYEPKPVWQIDAGCANRTDNDVAAVADPFTGVAFYDTDIITGYTIGGWSVVGGTSVSAPIIAATYALAGANPASLHYGSYSYSHPDDLNDITVGNDGSCAPVILYLCSAVAGYDGPTGNGTPNGTGAFGGPSGPSAANMPWVPLRQGRRGILQPAATARTRRVCESSKQPGIAACMAILVLPQ
jgi:subtilase family serine protease